MRKFMLFALLALTCLSVGLVTNNMSDEARIAAWDRGFETGLKMCPLEAGPVVTGEIPTMLGYETHVPGITYHGTIERYDLAQASGGVDSLPCRVQHKICIGLCKVLATEGSERRSCIEQCRDLRQECRSGDLTES